MIGILTDLAILFREHPGIMTFAAVGLAALTLGAILTATAIIRRVL